MTQLPSLADPTVANSAVLVGFSYSLAPDGSPGSYNEQIAQSIRADLQKAIKAGGNPWVGMQWEIYDAIVEYDRQDTFKAAPSISNDHVAPPPKLRPADLKPAAFVELLDSEATEALLELRAELLNSGCNLANAARDAYELTARLNTLLGDRRRFSRYRGKLELHDLHRTHLGAVGTEKRILPDEKGYREGLREFQAVRVNRLILEALCPDSSVLSPGQYLSTKGVLDLLLPQVTRTDTQIKYIFVYGHPQHSPRCWRQTSQSLQDYKIDVPESHVFDVHAGQEWRWDDQTAQVWCRSLGNWRDYEGMGSKRLLH
jgi:hypothetical protein